MVLTAGAEVVDVAVCDDVMVETVAEVTGGVTDVVGGVVDVDVEVTEVDVETAGSAAARISAAAAASQDAANRVGACPLAVAGTEP